MLSHWWFCALLAGLIAVGFFAGFFCAVALAPIFLPPIYKLRAFQNGAPFHEGDYVRVLVPPLQDVVACVYEIWPDRSQLRIDLGADSSRALKDVFSFVEVCRVANAEPSDARETSAQSVLNSHFTPRSP